ncbi:MAG: NADH-quinone oxidoreductase subunit C [Planctomycetia bacterium]|nr:NADH-quinone oxidoreductase subunit C [Planctomycetia bacterium]
MADTERIAVVRERFDATASLLRGKLGSDVFTTSTFRDNCRLIASSDKVYVILEACKLHGFDMLADMSGADYLHYPDAKDRYGVWYCLVNTSTGERVIVKTYVNDPNPTLPSVYGLWKGCDWMEREVYDMYGIEFKGHPDLRRILLPDEFSSFPLRKDYPMRGKGERHNFNPILRSES